ncbi:MAG TPA: class II aldolase/adducin family protein [Anaerovoracaceae bacterium]|nr:class II aldolase/adducin family protein [Anaerovoracaceae bacterium]
MAYSMEEAKELVIRAGKMLAESGLIARTWGNISARISDTQFVITPSGLAYETLTPEQIVAVNTVDCSYQGNIKPSSEKGIHADAYRLRPEVNFIIHTHQPEASVISIEGADLNVYDDEHKKILGDTVPCAAYGISSTGKLRKAVAAAVRDYPGSKALLMKYHGTLCMGNGLENCFEIAKTLEKISEERYRRACAPDEKTAASIKEKAAAPLPDYGRSRREGNAFVLQCDGEPAEYLIDGLPEGAPKAAALHGEIYKRGKASHIIHSTDAEVVEVSGSGRILKPFLDDLAQIAGVNIKPVKNGLINVKAVAKELKHKNAVLLEDAGALCTGITKNDAEAVAMVLRKGCAADLYAAAIKKTDRLSTIDAYLQRIVYVTKYSKQKK